MRGVEDLNVEWKKGLRAEVEWSMGGGRAVAIDVVSRVQPISHAELADPALRRRLGACMLGSNRRKRLNDPV